MKRNADSIAPAPSKPGPASVAIGSVVMVGAASLAIVVCGALVLTAVSGTGWGADEFRVVLSVAAAPWALVVVLLTGSAWRLVTRSLPPDVPQMRGDVLPEYVNTEASRLRVEVGREQADGSHTISVMHLDGIRGDQLVAFAQQVSRGASLAVSQWTGAGSPFTRPQYDRLMSELQTADLVTAGAGNQARQLTAAGRGVMRRVASGEYEMD